MPVLLKPITSESLMRKVTLLRVLALAALLAANIAAHAQQPQPTPTRDRLSIEQFLDWEYVSAPQISPDGRQIVYTRRWPDKVNDKYEDEVWIMDSDGGRRRFLVKGSQPVWSADSRRIAYVAPGQPSGAQIWARWVDLPGETQLTHLERAPSNLAWSP